VTTPSGDAGAGGRTPDPGAPESGGGGLTAARAVMERRSIRSFAPGGLEPEVLDRLLEAARRAPTAAMGHFYSMIVVRDPEVRRKLFDLCGRQRAVRRAEFLVFCAALRRSDTWAGQLGCRRRISGYTALLFGTIDATLAAHSLVIYAEGQGLGSCYIGMVAHRADGVAEALDLPRGVLPLLGLAVGRPAESPPLRPRIPLQFLAHREKYEDMTPQQVQQALEAIGTAWVAAGDDGDFDDSPGPGERGLQLASDRYRRILEADWWEEGEAQLRRALERQGLMPE